MPEQDAKEVDEHLRKQFNNAIAAVEAARERFSTTDTKGFNYINRKDGGSYIS